MHIRSLKNQYLFRIAVSLLWAVVTGALWMSVWTNRGSSHICDILLFWAVVATLALFVLVYWQYGLYRAHTRKVLFLPTGEILRADTGMRKYRYSGSQ